MRRYNMTLTQSPTGITVTLNENEDVEVLLVQGGSGNRLVTWSGVNTWLTSSGTAPVLKTVVGASDLLTFSRTGGLVYGTHTGDTGPAGATGPAGPAGITWRGAYSSGTTYATNDVVSFGGSSYISTQDTNLGNRPDLSAAVWNVLAAAAGSSSLEIVDTFQRANNANVSTGAPNGMTYTVYGSGANIEILSNMLHPIWTTGGPGVFLRCETILTSPDHHAQVTIGAVSGIGSNGVEVGPVVRYDSATNSGYMARLNIISSNTYRFDINKITTGGVVLIGTTSTLPAVPTVGDRLRLDIVGSVLTARYNDAITATATDTTYTTGVRCGLVAQRDASAGDISLSELRFGA